MYTKFLIFKLPNASNKDASSICKRLLSNAINKRNKELQHVSKEFNLSKNVLSKQLSTIDYYILTKFITLGNKKSLQISLYTQQKELSSLTRDFLKSVLYFSIQPDKIRKSEIFSIYQDIHCLFISNLKSEETKSQIKLLLWYLANSYFYRYKPSPCILHQHRVLQYFRKNIDIVITRPDKGNKVVILDRKLYKNAIQ